MTDGEGRFPWQDQDAPARGVRRGSGTRPNAGKAAAQPQRPRLSTGGAQPGLFEPRNEDFYGVGSDDEEDPLGPPLEPRTAHPRTTEEEEESGEVSGVEVEVEDSEEPDADEDDEGSVEDGDDGDTDDSGGDDDVEWNEGDPFGGADRDDGDDGEEEDGDDGEADSSGGGDEDQEEGSSGESATTASADAGDSPEPEEPEPPDGIFHGEAEPEDVRRAKQERQSIASPEVATVARRLGPGVGISQPARKAVPRPQAPPVGVSRISERPVDDLPVGLGRLTTELRKLGITNPGIDAMISLAQENPEAKAALTRLAGRAALVNEVSGKAGVDLMQEYGALPRNGNRPNVPYLFNLPPGPALEERMIVAVASHALFDSPFDLSKPEQRGADWGSPQPLGRLTSVQLWYFNAEDGRTRTNTTGLDLVNRLLGRDPNKRTVGRGLREGDYIVVSLEVVVPGSAQKHRVFVLTSVNRAGGVSVPSKADETRYRMAMGIVDGFAVQDLDRAGAPPNRIWDDLAYSPYLLTRNMIRGRRRGSPMPDTVCRPSQAEIYYLEPAWMALRKGLLPVEVATFAEADREGAAEAKVIQSLRKEAEGRARQHRSFQGVQPLDSQEVSGDSPLGARRIWY